MLCSLVRLCCRGGVGTCHTGKAGEGGRSDPWQRSCDRPSRLCPVSPRRDRSARDGQLCLIPPPLPLLFLSSRRWEGKDENEVGRCLETGCVHVRVDHKYYRPTEVVSATPPAKLIWCGGGGVMSLVTRLICTLGTPRPAPPHRRLMVLP